MVIPVTALQRRKAVGRRTCSKYHSNALTFDLTMNPVTGEVLATIIVVAYLGIIVLSVQGVRDSKSEVGRIITYVTWCVRARIPQLMVFI
ncbi:hypothetical protein BDN67DRAFT_967148 [Paxillus ammoniavirescens]|nr:hypothetical protein BDN67DRAFT_967148 [Paxillus ammoniavirescens]